MYKPFQTTIWSSIRLARDGQPTAVGDFVGRYREPVHSYFRRQGFSEEDAEDLCQEVFMLLVKDDLLGRAERERGRFRNFLLGVTRNVSRNALRARQAERRGGGTEPMSLDTLDDFPGIRETDDAFDRDWIRLVIQRALDVLSRRHAEAHRVMSLLVESRATYADIAKTLGLDEKQVDNKIQQARTLLGELMRAEVAAYCGSREEFDDEIAILKKFLAPAKAREARS